MNIPERFYCQFRIPLYMNLNQPFQKDKSQLFFYALENIIHIKYSVLNETK